MRADALKQYVHEALFYESSQSLLDSVAPFLREGIEAGDEVVLVCNDVNNHALAETLGGEPVTYLPRPEIYQKAVTAVVYYRDFIRSRLEAGSRRLRLVGQVDFGTNSRAWDEWRRFEALSNHALAPFPLWSLCAYDTAALSDSVVATGELTHPYVRRGAVRGSNPAYVDPVELLRLPDTDLEPLADLEPTMTVRDVSDLRDVQHRLRSLLLADAMGSRRVEDVVLVVNELATNAVRHGRPPVAVRVWLSSARVVCTVSDTGPGFEDPLAGYLPGGQGSPAEGGFGLYLARRLCDELVTMRTPEGFTVRIVVRR